MVEVYAVQVVLEADAVQAMRALASFAEQMGKIGRTIREETSALTLFFDEAKKLNAVLDFSAVTGAATKIAVAAQDLASAQRSMAASASEIARSADRAAGSYRAAAGSGGGMGRVMNPQQEPRGGGGGGMKWMQTPNIPDEGWGYGHSSGVPHGGGGGGMSGRIINPAAKPEAAAAGGGYNVMPILGSPAGLAAGFTIYEAMKLGLMEDYALNNQVMQMHFSQAGKVAAYGRLRELAAQTSTGTIFSRAETAQALAHTIGFLGYKDEEGLGELEKIAPTAMRTAEVAQMTVGGSLNENLKALIGYAHMTHQYAGPKLTKESDWLLALAQASGKTPTELLVGLKQAVPAGSMLGVKPDEIATTVAFLSRQGLNPSTAGTATSNVLLGLTETGGPINAHLMRGHDRLQEALGLGGMQPGDYGGKDKHRTALEALGLLDKSGRLTVLDQAGNVDLDKVWADIAAYSSKHTGIETLSNVNAAFNRRGVKGVGELSTAEDLVNFATFKASAQKTFGGLEQQQIMAGTPLQQTQQAYARLKDVMTDLSDTTLTQFGAAMKTATTLLEGFDQILRHQPGMDRVIGKIAVSAATGATIGGVIGLLGGPIGVGSGMAIGAGAGGLLGVVQEGQGPEDERGEPIKGLRREHYGTSVAPIPPSGQPRVQLHGDVNIDGQKVGKIVADEIAHGAAAPPAGSAGSGNLRISPDWPSMNGSGF